MKKKSLLIFLLTAVSATTVAAVGCAQKHQHNYTWQSNAQQHWEECECGDKQNEGSHSDNNNDGKCDICAVASYALTFDMQGHGTAPSAQTIYKGGKFVKPATDPSDDGYVFGGWYSDAACETPFDFDAAVTASKTVYAKWCVTLTFNLKGHGAAVDAQSVKVGANAVKPATDPVDANHEYLFDGWYSDEDCETVFDFTSPLSSNATVYAKWVPDNRPLVTFDLGEDLDSIKQRVEAGSTVSKPADPEFYHNIFGGWYTDNTYGTEFDFENTEITEDTTVYAKWDYDLRFYVTFNVMGHGTAPAYAIANGDGYIEAPEAPTAEGLTFAGWYLIDSFDDEYWLVDFENDQFTEDTTLYARWTVIASFHINESAPATLKVNLGGVISDQYLTPPANGDFDFGGWYTDADCTEEFNSAAPITADTHLYAKWVPAMPKLVPGEFKLCTFGSENTLQFSFTSPKTARYKLQPYNTNTYACYFTTSLDDEGVYYGEDYDANEKFFRLSAGTTITVTLYRGAGIADDAKVALSVEEVEDDFPDNWVSGTYTDGQITIEFNKEDKTVKWDDTTYSVQYSEKDKQATFPLKNFTCTIKYLGVDRLGFKYASNSAEVTLTRVEKQQKFDVDKFSGVYEPVDAEGQPTAKLSKVSKVVVYESGNGIIALGSSTNEAYKLGESGASYVYDGVTNVLQYENYRITANLDGDGNVVSISISNPTIMGGSTPVVYTRTAAAPDEPPENLPLPNNSELIGATYFIKNGRWGSNSKPAFDYGITITAYNKTTGIYTVSCNGTYNLQIEEGEDDAITVYVYDVNDGTLKDTLEKKVVKSNVLIIDGTNNEVTSDMVSNDVVIYTIPKTGVFSITVLDASPKASWGGINPVMFYCDYENDPTYIYVGDADMASEKFGLQQGNKFAVSLVEYGASFQSLTFILTEAVPDPGSTPEDAIVINGADSKTSAVTMDGNYYVKFIAAEAGTYNITLTYIDWGDPSYNIDYKVDGVQNGAVAADWVTIFWTTYYKDGVLLEDPDDWDKAPYTTVTVTAGQEVSIVFVGHSYYENVTITIEKV